MVMRDKVSRSVLSRGGEIIKTKELQHIAMLLTLPYEKNE